ncbi:hypothetical protein [Kribbella deserti]|uniref:Uncharacterized protein n=1 Tax=Kribbella deserti TaxID=1926257 RepID=A0ABV6QGS2_9ACTN
MTGGPRSEIVDALVNAMMNGDLAGLEVVDQAGGFTAEERAQADALFAAQLEASAPYRRRGLEAWEVLLDGRTFDHAATWDELFDGLSNEAIERLGTNLYDSMHDAMRVEYDRRFGRPNLDGAGDV